MSYCTQQDVYRFIPPGSLPNPGREITDLASASAILTLDGHGFTSGQSLNFRTDVGTLPAPISAGVTYYAIPLTASTFSVSSTVGGPAITLSSDGSNVVVVGEFPWADWIAECSAMVDQTLPAHVVPITGTIPEPIRTYTAALLAMRVLSHVGAQSAAIQSSIQFYEKQAQKWAKHAPLRGANAPRVVNVAAINPTSSDSRGWSTDGRIP